MKTGKGKSVFGYKALIKNKIQEEINILVALQNDDRLIALILKAAEPIVHAVKAGNKLMICGNGGSAADAQHIAGEFLCRFYKDRDSYAGNCFIY